MKATTQTPLHWFVSCSLLLVLAGAAQAHAPKKDAAASPSKITPEQKAAATPRLWEARDISGLNLANAGAPPELAPQGPFQFVEEDKNATAPKLIVRDAAGRKWRVKLARSAKNSEVHAESAANRIFWACGYRTETTYYVPGGVVTGLTPAVRKTLTRVGKLLLPDPQTPDAGRFTEASFRLKGHKGILDDSDTWSLTNPKLPFAGTPQFSGLKLLNVLLNNWDVTDLNNKVVYVPAESGSGIDAWYEISDAGASFGRLPAPSAMDKLTRTLHYDKWDLAKFRHTEDFISGVEGGDMLLKFQNNPFGKAGDGAAHRKIPVANVRWFVSVIGKVTPDQFHQIFQAAGASPEEVSGFTDILLNKIARLKQAAGE